MKGYEHQPFREALLPAVARSPRRRSETRLILPVRTRVDLVDTQVTGNVRAATEEPCTGLGLSGKLECADVQAAFQPRLRRGSSAIVIRRAHI